MKKIRFLIVLLIIQNNPVYGSCKNKDFENQLNQCLANAGGKEQAVKDCVLESIQQNAPLAIKDGCSGSKFF